MNPLDIAVFRAINGWSDNQKDFWLFLSKGLNQGGVKIVLALLLIALLINKKTRRGGLVAGTAWILANAWTDLFKAAIPFPRPLHDLPDVIERVGGGSQMGTASAHAANMMCVAICFVWYFRWWGSPWVILALLVGISRVYVGAHYPSQVLLGWTVGAVTAILVCGTVDHGVKLWQKKFSSQSPELDPSHRPSDESLPS